MKKIDLQAIGIAVIAITAVLIIIGEALNRIGMYVPEMQGAGNMYLGSGFGIVVMFILVFIILTLKL